MCRTRRHDWLDAHVNCICGGSCSTSRQNIYPANRRTSSPASRAAATEYTSPSHDAPRMLRDNPSLPLSRKNALATCCQLLQSSESLGMKRAKSLTTIRAASAESAAQGRARIDEKAREGACVPNTRECSVKSRELAGIEQRHGTRREACCEQKAFRRALPCEAGSSQTHTHPGCELQGRDLRLLRFTSA